MKFNQEELEKVQDSFNGLFDKCNLAMGTISRELRKILNETEYSTMKTYLRWEFGDHLKSVDDLTITKNGLELWNDELTLHMFSEEFEDGVFEFKVPQQWLEVEDDKMEVLIKQWIRGKVDSFIEIKKLQLEKNQEDKKNDLVNRIKEFDKEQVIELLKEIPEYSELI